MSQSRKNRNLEQAVEQLSQVGAVNLTARAQSRELPRAHARDAAVGEVLAALAERQSAPLLGPTGVGKTAVLYEAIRRLAAGA